MWLYKGPWDARHCRERKRGRRGVDTHCWRRLRLLAWHRRLNCGAVPRRIDEPSKGGRKTIAAAPATVAGLGLGIGGGSGWGARLREE